MTENCQKGASAMNLHSALVCLGVAAHIHKSDEMTRATAIRIYEDCDENEKATKDTLSMIILHKRPMAVVWQVIDKWMAYCESC